MHLKAHLNSIPAISSVITFSTDCFHLSFVKPGETLKDFYKRTNMYWQMAAHEHTQHTGKVCLCFLILAGTQLVSWLLFSVFNLLDQSIEVKVLLF